MHQEFAAARVVYRQGLLQQPLGQRITITGLEHRLQRVAIAQRTLRVEAVGQQVQVMVAQHGDGVGAQGADQPQHLQGLRTAVDQVPGEHQLVAVR